MVELSFEELDRLINEVSSGEKLIYVDTSDSRSLPVLLRHPTPEDTRRADYVLHEALVEAKAQGLPSMVEMETVLRGRGIYTEEDEGRIGWLQGKLEVQRAVLAKTTRVPARRDRLLGIISDLENQIAEIRLKKEVRLEDTYERKAAEERLLYLTWRGARCLHTGKRYWKTQKLFEEERDFIFRKKVFLEYTIFSHGIRQNMVRFVARSNLWRLRYVTATKTNDSLFGRPISCYTVDQLMLLYWSHYYQSIYDMLSDDKPPDSIIEDDEALDAYMKDWHEERNRDSVSSRAKKSNRGKISAWDYDETMVMRSNDMYEDIKYSDTLTSDHRTAGKTTLDAAPINKSKQDSKGVFSKER